MSVFDAERLLIKDLVNGPELIKEHSELHNAVVYTINSVIVSEDIVIRSANVFVDEELAGSLIDQGLGWKFYRGHYACPNNLKKYLDMNVSDVLDFILDQTESPCQILVANF